MESYASAIAGSAARQCGKAPPVRRHSWWFWRLCLRRLALRRSLEKTNSLSLRRSLPHCRAAKPQSTVWQRTKHKGQSTKPKTDSTISTINVSTAHNHLVDVAGIIAGTSTVRPL
jgi:hypothetical protein